MALANKDKRPWIVLDEMSVIKPCTFCGCPACTNKDTCGPCMIDIDTCKPVDKNDCHNFEEKEEVK